MPKLSEHELIEGTIRDIEDSIDKLQMEKDMLEMDLKDKQARLDVWKARLAQTGNGGTVKIRRRKGQNLRTILELFEKTDSAKGLAIGDIVRDTGLSWSSVRAILKREDGPFIEGNGVWHLKRRLIPAGGINMEVERGAKT